MSASNRAGLSEPPDRRRFIPGTGMEVFDIGFIYIGVGKIWVRFPQINKCYYSAEILGKTLIQNNDS